MIGSPFLTGRDRYERSVEGRVDNTHHDAFTHTVRLADEDFAVEVRAVSTASPDYEVREAAASITRAGGPRAEIGGFGALAGARMVGGFTRRLAEVVGEYANREMSEIELWSEFPSDKEVAVGVIDVKAFRVETPEEVADRARLALKHLPAERLWLVPDCGLWETPRWVGIAKLRSMVEAARVLRHELGAGPPGR